MWLELLEINEFGILLEVFYIYCRGFLLEKVLSAWSDSIIASTCWFQQAGFLQVGRGPTKPVDEGSLDTVWKHLLEVIIVKTKPSRKRLNCIVCRNLCLSFFFSQSRQTRETKPKAKG